jgi:DNA-binding NtrC family response regulator
MESRTITVLVVEDEAHIRDIVKFRLEKKSYRVRTAASGEEAMTTLQEHDVDAILLDLHLPGRSGLDILQDIRQSSSLAPVIIVTANSSVDMATQALRHGAIDYLLKPINFDELEVALINALERTRGARQGLAVQRLVEARAYFPTLITESPVIRSMVEAADRAAASASPILILGESGTGKELIARRIHLMSPRRRSPFLPLNCAGLSETLLESELFGHEKGAFTGASDLRRGLFEVAHQGTLFMDEIGEMSPAIQASLLRVLETGEFRRLGGRTCLYTDVRIVAATNRDLRAEVAKGAFRQDLFYRLNTVILTMPPLRERKQDIWPLAHHFLHILSRESGKPRAFDPAVRTHLESYDWPGNVRELRNVVERLALMTEGPTIDVDDLPVELFGAPAPVKDKVGNETVSLRGMEKRHILKVLAMTGGNRRQTSRMLRISEPTLYRKLKEYGVTDAPESASP